MKRGTASRVILGKNTIAEMPGGVFVGTDVILGKKDGLTNDFNGLVLSNTVMFGKKVSHAAIISVIVRGANRIVLPDAIANSLSYVKAFGGTEQNGTPTPDAPVDIVSNNGVLKVSPNLVEFNETRINSSTWTSADKTKGFEVYADVYGKTVGANMLTNPNCFGVFVPCKQGKSVSLNFFDYEPRGLRTYYCEITADAKCNTAPAFYYDGTTSTFITNTLTLTQADSIGFVIEFEISAQQERTYDATNYMVVRGTTPPTTYMPYGQIYTDGTVETINVHGKNLFDGVFNDGWGISASDGMITSSAGRKSFYIPVKAGQKYTISRSAVGESSYWYYGTYENEPYAASQVCVSYGNMGTSAKQYTITIPNGANYLVIFFGTGTSPNVQAELGSTATEYAPYYDGGTATAEMLLKVGDYKDVQEILSGAVTRNIGVKVLDGTEDWTYSEPNTYGIANLAGTIIGKVDGNTNKLICSHFVPQTTVWASTQTEGVLNGNSNNQVFFRVLGTRIPSLAAWQQWLADQYAAGTPVIVVYPLATPTTESVAGQTLQVTDGDNVLEITQASLDGLELEAQYNTLVQLTVQEVESANLDNDVTVTIQ